MVIKKTVQGDGVDFKYAKGKIDIYGNMLHDYHEIYFFLGGEVEYVGAHTRRTLSANDVVVIPRGEYHQLFVKGNGEDYERCVLNIHRGFLEEELLETLQRKVPFSLPEGHRILENLLYLKTSLDVYEPKDMARVLSAVATDIIFSINHLALEPSEEMGSLRPLSAQIMDYVDQSCFKDLSIEDIVDRFYMSPSSVSHIFKTEYGISIKRYVMEKRMIEAMRALEVGKKPQEISDDLGFHSYSNFYRAFVKRFGISPSKAKKR